MQRNDTDEVNSEAKKLQLLKTVKDSVRKIITVGSHVYQRKLLTYWSIISDDAKVGKTRQNYLKQITMLKNDICDKYYNREKRLFSTREVELIKAGLTIIKAAESILESRAGNCTEYGLLSLYKLFIEGMQGSAELFHVGKDHVIVVVDKNPNEKNKYQDAKKTYDFNEWHRAESRCYILDAWANKIMLPTEIPTMYFGGKPLGRLGVELYSSEHNAEMPYSFEALNFIKEIAPELFSKTEKLFRKKEEELFEKLELSSENMNDQKQATPLLSFSSFSKASVEPKKDISTSVLKADENKNTGFVRK